MKIPALLSLPHCAVEIPLWLKERIVLKQNEIVDSVDRGSEEVFCAMPVFSVIKAKWSRLVVDLNRKPDSFGKKGVVARTDYQGREIYLAAGYPGKDEIEKLVQIYYNPFHEEILRALANPAVEALFDCHSLEGTGPSDAPDTGEKRRDIILSNNGDYKGRVDAKRGYITCSVERLALIKKAFHNQGFSVGINSPYRGGFITQHYGKQLMTRGKFAVQIEMNQDLILSSGRNVLNNEKIKSVQERVLSAMTEIF